MTDSPNQPAGKSPEAPPPDSTLLADKLAQSAQLTHGLVTAGSDLTHLKAEDNRSATVAFFGSIGTNALQALDGLAATTNSRAASDAEVQNRIKHNLAPDEGHDLVSGAAIGLTKSVATIALHPLNFLEGLKTSGENFGHAVISGKKNERAEALGSAAFLAGTFLVGFAGNLGKLGTESKALGLADQAMAETGSAGRLIGEYKVTEAAFSRAAAVRVDDLAVARAEQTVAGAAEKTLAVTAKPVASAVTEASLKLEPAAALEAATPTSTAANVGARLHLPTFEPVTPPSSLVSRLTSKVTAPFKSLLGTTDGAVGESGVSRVGNLIKEEKPPLGTLPTQLRVDGLRTGDVTLPGVKTGEGLAGEGAGEPIIKVPVAHIAPAGEPIKLPGAPVEPAGEPTIKGPGANGEPVGATIKTARVEQVGEPTRVATARVEPAGKIPGAHIEAPGEPSQIPAGRGQPVKVAPIIGEPVGEGGPGAKIEVRTAPGAEGSTTPGALNGERSTANLALESAGKTPSVIAGQASNDLEGFTRLASQNGLALSPDAQRGLQELSEQLKAVSQGTEGTLSAAAKNAISKNMATVEESLTASGADESVAGQFSQFKASVNELAPSTVAQIAPISEAPVALAAKASTNLESFTQVAGEKGLALSPDAQRGLQELSEQLKAVSQGTDGALSAAARNAISKNMATVEESLTASGADESVARQFSQFKASVNEIAPETVAQIAPISETPVALAQIAPVSETPGALAQIAPISETPVALASKASENLQSFTQAAGEKGLVLSPDAQRGLQALSEQLKAVSQGTDEALSVAARSQISKNIATVEESLSGADPALARQFSELKASVNELVPSTVGPLAPVTEAPVALASQAGQDLQAFRQAALQKSLGLSPEAEQSLENINAHVQSFVEGKAVPLTAQASTKLAQDLATVERSLATSQADASLFRQFAEVKASVGDLSAAAAEREQIALLHDSLSTLDTQGAELSTSVRTLSQQLKEMPGMSAVDQKVASTISQRLDAIEQKIAQGGLTETPVATTSDIQQFVADIDKPEYSPFFANNPEAARAFEEVKASTSAVAATTSTVESAQIGIGGIRQAEIFQQDAENLAVLSRDLRVGLPAAEASQPVATALQKIESDLGTIRGGANSEAVLRRVQDNIAQIEAAGGGNLVTDLKQGLGELENSGTALDRTRRLETSISTIQTEGSALETQSARLSQRFGEDAITAPSTTALVPTNTQVAEQLQLISRQAKLLDASEAGTAAVTKIKDAFTRVEDLTAQGTLTGEQSAVLQEMRASIAKIDQASVEATGLRTFENNAAKIAAQSSRVETITADIARSVDLTSTTAVDAQAEQRLAAINQAAQDLRAARTLAERASAETKLATAVQDPELQAYLSANQTGARSLAELQTTAAQVHESVVYANLERSQAIAAAEAENSVNAARALEARVQNDLALSNAQAVQVAATEYRQAAEAFVGAPDKNLAAAQMERKLSDLQAQFTANATSTTVAQGEEMAALRRAQAGLNQSLADSELSARSLIDHRLPVIESGFSRIADATTTVAQRDMMRNLSGQIQDLRYLDRTGTGADQLAQAQMLLTKAQNDLEVATFRGNLVKLAAAGDQSATDRLLISGLTSDGYKATAMAGSSGPAARLVEDFAKNRTNVQGLMDQASYSVRSMAASDPLYVNNAGWLSANAIRNTGYTLMGTGLATTGLAAYRNSVERAGTTDKATPAGANPQVGRQAGQSVPANLAPTGSAAAGSDGAAAQGLPRAQTAPDTNRPGRTATDAPVTTAGGITNSTTTVVAPESRVIGHSAGEPNGFSPNGQTLARNAFSQNLATQALPRSGGALGTAGGSDNLNTSVSFLPSDSASLYRPAADQVGSFTVYKNDVNMTAELNRLQYSGTIFLGTKYGGDPAVESALITPFALAQTLHIGGGGHAGAAKALEKPATSQFAMPSTSLSSPFALGVGVGQKPGMLATRLGGPAFGGAAGIAPRAGDASLKLASLSDGDADAEEAGSGAGTKHLKGVEKTEKRLDTHAAHAGGGSATAQNNGNDDEEGTGNDPDPTVSANATSPSAGSPAAGSPSAGRSLPPAAKPGQPPVVAVAESDEQSSGAALGAPPRRRATQDAISA